MTTFIALLRGVMPTGKNRVPMAQLRQILTDSTDFENVKTWIQSGNVIFRTSLAKEKVSVRVNALIKEHIGADLKIIVKTPQEIQKVLNENPFGNGFDISRVFFTLFNEVADKELIDDLKSVDFGEERFYISEHAIYIHIPGSAERSKLSNNFIERKLKIDTTTRNFNTLSKMVELSESYISV